MHNTHPQPIFIMLTSRAENRVDPDQMASLDASWSGPTMFSKRINSGSARQGLTLFRPMECSIMLHVIMSQWVLYVLFNYLLVTDKCIYLNKQWRPRWNAALCNISSGLHCLLRHKWSSEKEIQYFFGKNNLWPLDIYNGLSKVYCIKPEALVHKRLLYMPRWGAALCRHYKWKIIKGKYYNIYPNPNPYPNPEIFARILFSPITLKDIFATLKICDYGMIYLYQLTTEWLRHFARILFTRNIASAKFRENKTLAKIFESTVHYYELTILGWPRGAIDSSCIMI